MAKNRKNKGKKVGGKARGRADQGEVDASAQDAEPLSFTLGAGVGVLFCVCLTGLLMVVHYGLWLGDNSVPEYVSLNHEIDAVRGQLNTLSERNEVLRTEVVGLKSGFAAVEARARNDLGLVKKGETFFQIIDQTTARDVSPQNPVQTPPQESIQESTSSAQEAPSTD